MGWGKSAEMRLLIAVLHHLLTEQYSMTHDVDYERVMPVLVACFLTCPETCSPFTILCLSGFPAQLVIKSDTGSVPDSTLLPASHWSSIVSITSPCLWPQLHHPGPRPSSLTMWGTLPGLHPLSALFCRKKPYMFFCPSDIQSLFASPFVVFLDPYIFRGTA